MRRRFFAVVNISAFFLLGAGLSRSATLLVPTDYATIQAALDASAPGDEVVVEPGTYNESAIIPTYAITLRSQSDNPYDTILDGTGNAALPAMIYFQGNTVATRTIRGFTLTNSEAHAVDIEDVFTPRGPHIVSNCRFINNGPETAVDASAGYLSVLNCEFIDNEGTLLGGAVLFKGPGIVRHCLFQNNHAIPPAGQPLTQGGAIALSNFNTISGTVDILDNTFENNTCTDYGGAVYVYENNVNVARNTFSGNVAGICAGGVYVSYKDNVVIEDNVFVDSSSPVGGTIAVDDCDGTIVRRNTIVNSIDGAGILVHNATNADIRQNIVAFGDSYGIRWLADEGMVVTGVQECNDAFGNPGGDYEGMSPDTTNTSVDPFFCDAAGGNFMLSSNSPCLDANNSCAVLIGALGEGCGPVARKRMTWGALKALFERSR